MEGLGREQGEQLYAQKGGVLQTWESPGTKEKLQQWFLGMILGPR